MFDLKGKTVLAAGGTRGIGQSMVLGLAEAGADVIIFQRNISDVKTQQAVLNLSRKCHVIECDMASRDSIHNALASTIDKFEVNIILNCAGIMRRIPAEKFDDQTYDDIIQTNLSSIFVICRELGAHWLSNGATGSIINVASVASFQGGINMAAYSASKGAVLQYSKALSNEWSSRGIRVNCVAPGYVETDMNVDTRTKADQTYLNSITDRIPMGRWGKADEFKGVVVFLASSASSYVTGQCITVDGGWMAR